VKRSRRSELEALVSVGPAARRDLEALGVHTLDDLRGADARALYERLCLQTGARQDPCVEDVFSAAIAQAKDPELPVEMRQWWFWSKRRKQRVGR